MEKIKTCWFRRRFSEVTWRKSSVQKRKNFPILLRLHVAVSGDRERPTSSISLFAFLVLAFPKRVEIRDCMLVFGDRILTRGGTGDS